MQLRAARPDEAEFLSDLAVRAKAYWGYDADFIRDCRVQLAVYPDQVVDWRVTVAERDGVVVGFYALEREPPVGLLHLMFVEPDHIRSGVGQALWAHAVETARVEGLTSFTIEADPFAEGFYSTMGAVRTGFAPSAVRPGRKLPLMTFAMSSG
jgi:GNAT superfamily N-acetyltransferase